MKNFIKNFVKGIVLGVANIIPGVSAGTIAVIFNIFDKILDSINNFFKEPLKHIAFLLPIVLGAFFGILFFSSIISQNLKFNSLPTNMLFVGLILGSLPFIFKKVLIYNLNLKNIMFCVSSFTILAALSLIINTNSPEYVDQNFTLLHALRFFLGGIIASSCMIIPGVSGSFMLMLFNLYNPIVNAISQLKVYLSDISNFEILFDILKYLVPLGFGVIVGIFLVSNILTKLLKNFYCTTYYVIIGLILGSIFGILTNQATYQGSMNLYSMIVSIITLSLGFFLSYMLGISEK